MIDSQQIAFTNFLFNKNVSHDVCDVGLAQIYLEKNYINIKYQEYYKVVTMQSEGD